MSITKHNLTSLLFLLFIAFNLQAQRTVDASEIVSAIKAGKDVTYENVVVEGVVDLTPYEEKINDLPKKRFWNGGDNKVEHTLNGNISFSNVTFKDGFYAYFNDDDFDYTDTDSKYTFIAHFDGKVVIKDCKFMGQAAFKYSDFTENTDFSGTVFNRDANFKYAEFKEGANFHNTNYGMDSNFKYAEFSTNVSFAESVFNDEANFKYTQFNKGTSFRNTEFKDDLNFKYTEIDGEFITDNMVVNGSMNTKYTQVNGRDYAFSGKKKKKH